MNELRLSWPQIVIPEMHCKDSWGFTSPHKRAMRGKTTHFCLSLRLSCQTKDYFLVATHWRMVLQGLPRLKAKDDVAFSRCSFAFDRMSNLAVSFKFTITNGAVQHRGMMQYWISHKAHFVKRSLWCAWISTFIIWVSGIELSNEMNWIRGEYRLSYKKDCGFYYKPWSTIFLGKWCCHTVILLECNSSYMLQTQSKSH